MLNRETLLLLVCPNCRGGGLRAACTAEGERLGDGVLTCEACGAQYPVEAGIPHLKAGVQQADQEWATWRDHLAGFAARRALRESVPRTPGSNRWRDKMRAFAQFIHVPDGRLLDVGCGPGNLRKLLDPHRVTYHGLDPLPVAGVEGFPFVCALAESIPFRSGTFSSLVVRSALDHFCDIDVFFEEASRVLVDEGQVFLEQVVHRERGFAGLVRHAIHSAKDVVDDMRTREHRKSAPKHMREFSQDSLMQTAARHFEVDRVEFYNSNWYTPTQVFISLRRRKRAPVGGAC